MQSAYDRNSLHAYYDRMQGEVDARRHSFRFGLLVNLSITGHSEHGCCWHRSCRCGLLFRGNGRSGWSPQTTLSSSFSMREVLDSGEACMWRI